MLTMDQVEVQLQWDDNKFLSTDSAIFSGDDNFTESKVAGAPGAELRTTGKKYFTRTFNFLQLNINDTQKNAHEHAEIFRGNILQMRALWLNTNLIINTLGNV